MGNSIAREAAHERLSKAIPQGSGLMTLLNSSDWDPPVTKAFVNKQHREQFIESLMILLSDNGKFDILNHTFSLMYLRGGHGGVIAVLVAMRNGAVERKVESSKEGKDQSEAFCCFVQVVEERMRVLLLDVLNALPDVALPADPPAYKC